MLTFNRHTDEVTSKMRSRMCLLNMVGGGGADWEWSRESMRMIFTATQRSVAEYGCPAWAPWISRSGMEKIETAQTQATFQRRCYIGFWLDTLCWHDVGILLVFGNVGATLSRDVAPLLVLDVAKTLESS